MSPNAIMFRRKRSLSAARRFRLCPPGEVKSLRAEEFDAHLRICPYCASGKETDLPPWEELAQRLRAAAGQGRFPTGETPGAEGDLCLVRKEKARWKDGYYYNPPAVLILERSRSLAGAVLVAQVYHDTGLAGPGDLILEKDRSPVGEIFVETWNTYTLRLGDLEVSSFKVDDRVLRAVKAMAAEPEAYPEWALHPRPMTSEDPRIYFREMEVEVGYVFASEAASELLRGLERSALRLAYTSPGEAVSHIRRKAPDVQWLVEPQSVSQVLAAARFPETRYALAAASEEKELFKANLVILRQGRVDNIEPLEGELFERVQEPSGVVLGGRLKIPPGTDVSEVLCFLETRDGAFLSPEASEWTESGLFRARFPVHPGDELDLFVAALFEAQDG